MKPANGTGKIIGWTIFTTVLSGFDWEVALSGASSFGTGSYVLAVIQSLLALYWVNELITKVKLWQ